VVPFAMRDSSRSVGMSRKIVKLCDTIVLTLWHGVLLAVRNDDGSGSATFTLAPGAGATAYWINAGSSVGGSQPGILPQILFCENARWAD